MLGALNRFTRHLALLALTLAAPFLMLAPHSANAQDITSNLVAHWKLDDAAAGPYVDSAGSLDCTKSGSPTSITGQIDSAINFNTTGVGTCGNAAGLDAIITDRTELTWGMWYKRDAVGDVISIGANADSGATDQITANTYSDNALWCTMNGAGGASYDEASYSLASAGINDTNWHMLTCVYDGSLSGNANRLKMYIDGAYVAASFAGGVAIPASIPTQTAPWILGPYGGSNADGALDEVRIYNRALSAADIAALYAYTGSMSCDASHAGVMIWNADETVLQYCNSTEWVDMGHSDSGDASGTCSNPDGAPGEVDYNATEGVLQYCDGANWINMGPASNAGAPTSGLIGYWKLDETSGSTISDSSGSGHNGTWADGDNTNVSDETIAGKVGTALDFQGSNHLVDLGDVSDYDFSGASDAFTLAAWVKADSIGGGQNRAVISKYNTVGNNRSWYWEANTSGRMTLVMSEDGTFSTSTAVGFLTSDPLTTGQWYHIAVTVDAATDTFVQYVDGVAVSTYFGTTKTTIDDIHSGSARVSIGQRVDEGFDPWDGIIDDVRIYNRALSAAEVNQLYETTGGSGADYTSNLIGHWPLNEGSGVDAANIADDEYNGTLANTPTWTTGTLSGAVSLNGTNQYLEIPNAATMDYGDVFTYALWIKRPGSSANAYEILVSKGPTAPVFLIEGTRSAVADRDKLRLCKWGSGCLMFSAAKITDTDWHHVAVTKNGADARMYIDGVESSGTLVNQTMQNNDHVIRIGEEVNGSSDPFMGEIDDVRIYNRALTGADIAALYSSGVQHCASPSGVPGEMVYNADHDIMQYCNGSDWIGISGVGTATVVPAADTTPDAFAFTDQTNVALSTLTPSNILQITGIDAATSVSISGGSAEFRTCSDAACSSEIQTWGTSAQTISNNQYLQLRLTSSASNSTAVTTDITVGGVSDNWSVTTAAASTPVALQTSFIGSGTSGTGVVTVSAGSNLAAIVFVGVNGGGSAAVTGVTLGGVAMTQIGSPIYNAGTTDEKLYAFYLINPSTGSKNISISTFDTSMTLYSGVILTGVHQTTPVSAVSSDNTSPLSVTPTGVTNGYPLLGATYWRNSGTPAFTSGSGQTRIQTKTNYAQYAMAIDTESPISGAQSLSYTLGGTVYAAEAIGIVALPANP